MTQVTIYLEPAVIDEAKNAALNAKTSLSRWMAGLVKEKTSASTNGWPADFWDMAGAWSDSDFPDVAAMRANEAPQTPRESF
jgi:hypothetical protein